MRVILAQDDPKMAKNNPEMAKNDHKVAKKVASDQEMTKNEPKWPKNGQKGPKSPGAQSGRPSLRPPQVGTRRCLQTSVPGWVGVLGNSSWRIQIYH